MPEESQQHHEELLPADFEFGVATSGYQIEGGFNGPGEPQNNWAEWEARGRVEPSGIACDFWNRFEEYLEHAREMRLSSFRLGIEWARCCPAENEVDRKALAHYRRILEAIRSSGMRPMLTLHHFTHPAWLGEDFWLSEESPEKFLGWVKVSLEEVGDLCDLFVTINEPNVLAYMSYVLGMFPPGRLAELSKALKALDNLMAAHVAAHAYIKQNSPRAVVGVNPVAMSVYESARLLTDLLVAKKYVDDEVELRAWVLERKREYEQNVSLPYKLDRAISKFLSKTASVDRALQRTVKAIFESEFETFTDCVQIDFYNPYLGAHVRVPFASTAGPRNPLPARMLWDDIVDPEAFLKFLKAEHEEGLPLLVVENGLCNRVRRGRSYPRIDGWSRPRMLREYLPKLVQARREGVDVRGYWHWSLMDNYEWGSYEPRFGILGIDRERGIKILEEDSMGYDSKGTYKELIAAMKATK